MAMSSIKQLKLAQRIRDNRNWLTLLFLLVGLIPGGYAVLNDVFPQVSPKYVLLGCVFVSVICAQFGFAWATRNLPKPVCVVCGGKWEIVESGPGRNSERFEVGGACPHCGAAISE
jgi:hypothetical protein